MLNQGKDKPPFHLPRPSALLSGVSLAIGIALTCLLIWTWWDAGRWSVSIADARYSLVVRHGRLRLFGPPPAVAGTGAARAMVARMSNADIDWTITLFTSENENVVFAKADRITGGTAEICSRFTGTPDGAIRPLMRALDDPNKVFAAHVALIKIRNTDFTSVDGEFQHGSTLMTLTHLDGFPVLLSPDPSQKPRIDLSGWQATRDHWHQRLDVQIAVINFEWLLMLSIAIPLLRLAQQVGRMRARSSGLCPNCRYDLTGNVSGKCPECGQAVAHLKRTPMENPPIQVLDSCHVANAAADRHSFDSC